MKRYLVFAGIDYYPAGGWNDFAGDADTLDEARQIVNLERRRPRLPARWWQIVDTTTLKVVEV